MRTKDHGLFTYEQVRAIDLATIQTGFPSQQLMGQAALALLLALQEDGWLAGPLAILAGSGNNGGDALALAFMLAGMVAGARPGPPVTVFLAGTPRTQESAFFLEKLKDLGQPIQTAEAFDTWTPDPGTLIIEGLLGAGQRGAPRGLVASLLQRVHELRRKDPSLSLLSVDVPAGLTEDGKLPFQKPLPDAIYCLGVHKLALCLHPDLWHVPVRLLPVGFHPLTFPEPEAIRIAATVQREIFRKRDTDHKYSAGAAALIGGSAGMEGALLLSARAFFAAGGGILFGHIPQRNANGPGLLLHAEPALVHSGFAHLSEKKWPAVVIGPGLAATDLQSMSSAIIAILKARLTHLRAIVLDAAGIELLQHPEYSNDLRARTIVTPHAGEYARYFGPLPVGTESLQAARRMALEQKITILLKGSLNLVFDRSGKLYILGQPTPALAAAGSGDVLVGILLAALAREHDLPERDRLFAAVNLHVQMAQRRMHPSATDFPLMIEEALAEGNQQ